MSEIPALMMRGWFSRNCGRCALIDTCDLYRALCDRKWEGSLPDDMAERLGFSTTPDTCGEFSKESA